LSDPGRSSESLARYRRLAWLLDESIRVPIFGWRIGLDALIGLVPGVGDLAASLMGGYGLLLAFRLRVPGPVLARMVLNVGIDTLVGAIPLAGDLFDMGFKANTRNRRLLDEWLANPRRTVRRSSWVVVAVVLAFVAVVGLSFWLVAVIVMALLGAWS
jgi:hypothetical protein